MSNPTLTTLVIMAIMVFISVLILRHATSLAVDQVEEILDYEDNPNSNHYKNSEKLSKKISQYFLVNFVVFGFEVFLTVRCAILFYHSVMETKFLYGFGFLILGMIISFFPMRSKRQNAVITKAVDEVTDYMNEK